MRIAIPDGFFCASCWSPLTLFACVFLLCLFVVYLCVRRNASKALPVATDDEENAFSLDIIRQSAPWGAEIVCEMQRPSFAKRKLHSS